MNPISIKGEILTYIWGFPLTNTILTSWVIVIILIAVSIYLSKVLARNDRVPGKFQNAVEMIFDAFIDFLATLTGDRKQVIRFLPAVGTLFFLILFSNWFGIIPGLSAIGFERIVGGKNDLVPIFRSVNSDLSMTLALTLIVVTVSHILGLATLGLKGHLKKFFRFQNPMEFFVGILEFISEFGKIISLSFRLFGNILAGEILLAVMTYLVPYLIPVPFLGLEVVVGLIQALVFAILAMVYFSTAMVPLEQH